MPHTTHHFLYPVAYAPIPLAFSFEPGQNPKGTSMTIFMQEAPAGKGMGRGGVNAWRLLHAFGIKQVSGYNGTFYELVDILNFSLFKSDDPFILPKK